jgi:YVTN family beta-propeller protein
MTNSRSTNGLAKRSAKAAVLLGTAAAGAMLLAGTVPTRADEHMVLVDKIAVPPGDLPSPVCVPGTGLGTFDISFADSKSGLYVLADRTNGAIDFFDASDDTYIGRVGGFTGVVCTTATPPAANNSKSGPDGVVIIGNQVWAGDGDSTLKVIDISSFKIVDTIPVTDPTDSTVKLRVDEMAYDANDHILAAANNANVPPFITLVNTDTHKILGQIVFDGSNGTPNATATGIEQSQWSPKTGLFYVSIPNIDPKDDGSGFVSVIDPASMKVIANYPVGSCGPAGLALGPRHEAIVGCGGSFGTPLSTQTVIINLDNGDILANITQAGGNDEVWFDPATQHYYLGARGTLDSSGKVTPILGTVDAKTFMFDGATSTSTTAHSVAADKRSHHVFVPIGYVPSNAPGTDTTNPCPDHGCIAVYLPSSVDDDDLGAPLAKH